MFDHWCYSHTHTHICTRVDDLGESSTVMSWARSLAVAPAGMNALMTKMAEGLFFPLFLWLIP